MEAVEILQAGSGAEPFTICIVATPRIRSPAGSHDRVPIVAQRGIFEMIRERIVFALFSGMPDQTEVPLADPALARAARVVSIWSRQPDVALIEHFSLLAPRRGAMSSILAHHRVEADVAFVVTSVVAPEAGLHAVDDKARGGVPFEVDGKTYWHCHYSREPGLACVHVHSDWKAIVHELQHALGSDANLQVNDLYNDPSSAGTSLNKRMRARAGDPVPSRFAVYDGQEYPADADRRALAYGALWRSFHCERHERRAPALMDDYLSGPVDVAPENDRITRQFVNDRLRAKLQR